MEFFLKVQAAHTCLIFAMRPVGKFLTNAVQRNDKTSSVITSRKTVNTRAHPGTHTRMHTRVRMRTRGEQCLGAQFLREREAHPVAC